MVHAGQTGPPNLFVDGWQPDGPNCGTDEYSTDPATHMCGVDAGPTTPKQWSLHGLEEGSVVARSTIFELA
jgi:hypothetical protein